ncbi:MAG TPA: hypothetical protein PLV61_02920 [Parvularculaceae bacterium]|nr:nuclear transport factor 2 family protein [Amphiplicatus sp.]MCB9955153.1 nuclear transport factor 2 family protein [Caulobacterales bacterium]HPE30116.1 hypothetical protein [Parvularculaceae bacterium]
MTLDQDRRIIREMLRDDYAMLSGPAGPRDYDRVKHYFHPAARLVRTGIGPDGEPFTTVMSVDDHHADVDEKLAKLDFLEEELEHDCEIFGNVARVRSVYRSVYGSGGAARENRGVNFFNLVRENGEWKIISVVWDNERDGLSLG